MTTTETEAHIVEPSTRVVLVKPGDLLLIGNVGHLGDLDAARTACQVFTDMGIKVVFFMSDIDMATVHDHA